MQKPLSNQEILVALEHYFDNPRLDDVRFFKMGAENSTAQVTGSMGTVVFRVWGDKHSRMGVRKISDIDDELAFMSACRSAGVPVPKVFTTKSASQYATLPNGQIFAVMEYVEGDEPSNFTPAMIDTLAVTIATMNKVGETFAYPVPRSWQGTIIDLAQERLAAFNEKGIDDEFIANLGQELISRVSDSDFSTVPFGPIHGDVMYQNIKYRGDVLSGVFDFDDCRESYIIEDITKALFFAVEDPVHCAIGDSHANVERFMHAYESVRPLSDAEKTVLPVLSLARFVYEYLKFHLHGAHYPDAAEVRKGKRVAYEKLRDLF